jgi:protocatechuate 3,4-dioxygenase beta subunit
LSLLPIARVLSVLCSVSTASYLAQELPPGEVVVRVLDLRGKPVGGVRLELFRRGADWTCELGASDSEGLLRCHTPPSDPQPFELRCSSPEWGLVAESITTGAVAAERVAIVGAALTVSGRVVDSQGNPIASAWIQARPWLDELVDFPLPLDDLNFDWEVPKSGADGKFAVSLVGVSDTRWELGQRGYETYRLAQPLTDPQALRITLRKLEVPPLQGVVVLPDGLPASGADVILDGRETKTDSAGRFSCSTEWTSSGTCVLAAVLSGWQPVVRLDAWKARAANPSSEPLRLELSAPALEIHGRVLDARGLPLADWQVELRDAIDLCPTEMPTRYAEHSSGRRSGPATTDADGSFCLAGLADRPYTVEAWDKWGAPIVVRSEPTRPGAGPPLLQVPSDAVIERVAGLVVAADGRPVSHATIEARMQIQTSFQGHSNSVGVPTTRSDSEGRFELVHVPRRYCELQLSGPGLVETRTPLDERVGAEPVRLVAARRCYLQLRRGEGSEAPTAMRALDGQARPLMFRLHFRGADLYTLCEEWELLDGKSPVLALPDTARMLVLLRHGAEVARQPLALEPGRVVAVSW